MLLKFAVENFRGFENKIELDLTTEKKYTFNKHAIKNGVVKTLMIYGSNGSGKSNLSLAIFDIIYNGTNKEHGEFYFENNFLNGDSSKKEATFYYKFKIKKHVIEYEYRKKAHDEIVFEELKKDGEVYFSYNREKDKKINFYYETPLDPYLDDRKISVLKYIRGNSKIKKGDILESLFKFLDTMLFHRCLDDRSYIGFSTGTENIYNYIIKNNFVEDFEKFIKELGIDLNLTTIIDSTGKKSLGVKFKNATLNFNEIKSTGTTALALFYYWDKQPETPSLLVIDEFDAFYHQKLSKDIVKKLSNLKTQVILTTHNSSLMQNDLLRPDCYYILDTDKIEPIYNLTEKELREAHNLEKMYRGGGFES